MINIQENAAKLRLFWSVLAAFGIVFLLSCQSRTDAQSAQIQCYRLPLKAGWHKNQMIQNAATDIYVPALRSKDSCQKLLLVLPGWKFSRQDWIQKSNLVSIADEQEMILVLPEMHTTIYETKYYPETIMKWNPVPGGTFIRDYMIPELEKKHGLFKAGYANYLMGLSTGGRGVVMVHLQNPGIFVGGAAFSGDYDQTTEPNDNLMRNVYGPIAAFRNRWQGEDNPVHAIEKDPSRWTMPLYLAHGKNDRVVSVSHSQLLYEVLQKAKGDQFAVTYNAVDGAGHDYKFWNSQIEPALRFFKNPKSFSDQPK